MARFLGRANWLLAGLFLAHALCACGSDRVVGAQCPGPFSGNATLKGSPFAGGTVTVGTSCAPCTSASPKLDGHGCPIFVTFDSCGGDVCLAGQRLVRPSDAGLPDAGDAGDETDAGSAGAEDADGG